MKSFDSMREVLNKELDKVKIPTDCPPILSDTVTKQIIAGNIADKGLAKHFSSGCFSIPRYLGPLREGCPEYDGGLDFKIINLVGRDFLWEFTAFPVGMIKHELIVCVSNPNDTEVINRMRKKLEWCTLHTIKIWKQMTTGKVIDVKAKFVVSHNQSIKDAIRSFSKQYTK